MSSRNEPKMQARRVTARRFRALKLLLTAGMLASLLHFADNTFAIDSYPEPAWITPLGVAAAWFVVTALAVVALTRRRPDGAFFASAAAYALLLLSGLLHYAFGAPMHMAMRSNATVLLEAFTGTALGFALFTSCRRGNVA